MRAAAEYSCGANQVNLSLYSDHSGAPGTLLAGPVTATNLPIYFSCCKLAVANFSTGVSVTAGTQYWVVADTPSSGTGSDFNGVWEWVGPSKSTVGVSNGGGWGWFQAAIQEPRRCSLWDDPVVPNPRRLSRSLANTSTRPGPILAPSGLVTGRASWHSHPEGFATDTLVPCRWVINTRCCNFW